MRKYLVERTVPGAGQMDAAALAAIAGTSNKVLRDLGPTSNGCTATSPTTASPACTSPPTRSSSASTGVAGGFPSTRVLEVPPSSTRRPKRCGHEPGGDQPHHRHGGPGEGDRRPAGGGRRGRGRPGHPDVPHQGGGPAGHRGGRCRDGVRGLPEHPRPHGAAGSRRRRAARLPVVLQRHAGWTRRRWCRTPGWAGTVQLWSGSATAPRPSATERPTTSREVPTIAPDSANGSRGRWRPRTPPRSRTCWHPTVDSAR